MQLPSSLDCIFIKIVKYVQSRSFGAAVESLKQESPDEFERIIVRLRSKAKDPDPTRRLNEIKTLRNLRPFVGLDSLLRVEGHLENAALPVYAKHPVILPGRHALTRLIVLNAHELTGHAGLRYTLTKILEIFWIIHGNFSVKYYIAECGKCAILKAKLIRQLMADFSSCRVTCVINRLNSLDLITWDVFIFGRDKVIARRGDCCSLVFARVACTLNW